LASILVSPSLVVSIFVLACFFLSFVLGWNNSSLTTGNLSNLVTYRIAVILTLSGIFVGFILEGSKMTQSILGKVVITSIGSTEILIGALVSLVLFLTLTLTEIPVSLSNCVVGSFVGVALASKATLSSISLIEILVSWLIAPFFCMGVAILIYEFTIRSERSVSLPTISWINRLVLFGSVFYVAYSLGANNVGMVLSFVTHANASLYSSSLFSSNEILSIEVVIYFGIALGTVLFGKSIAKVLGEKIVALSQIKTLAAILGTAFVTWVLTQFSIPVSLTQIVVGGMLGAGIARGPTVINRKEVLTMILLWTAVTILCALAGFAIEYAAIAL
jgi:inorganic phosphate transporter, PiT family